MKRTVPRPARTPLLVAVLLLLQVAVPGPVEALRLRVLAALATPWTWLGAFGEIPSPPEGVQVPDLVPPGRGGFVVLDVDLDRRRALVAGGHGDGVRRGALALGDEAAAGIVDVVGDGLSRVQLLDAAGSSLLVAVATPGRRLPGDLDRLVGMLAGRGGRAEIVDAFLPGEFRTGDRIVTAAAGEPAEVGVVTGEGVRPEVRLALDPAALNWVAIRGAAPRSAIPDLFEDRGAVTLVPRIADSYLALVHADDADIPIGTAIHAGGWLLGRVLERSGELLLVRRPEEPGEVVRGLALGVGPAVPVQVVGRGGGELGIVPMPGHALPAGEFRVVTAGGQELLPRGLAVVTARWLGTRIEVTGRPPWPARVLVARFRYATERQRLLGTGTR